MGAERVQIQVKKEVQAGCRGKNLGGFWEPSQAVLMWLKG